MKTLKYIYKLIFDAETKKFNATQISKAEAKSLKDTLLLSCETEEEKETTLRGLNNILEELKDELDEEKTIKFFGEKKL